MRPYHPFLSVRNDLLFLLEDRHMNSERQPASTTGATGSALEETLAIVRDADTMRRLAKSDAELAHGEEVTAAELAETIRNRLERE
jgi:hypothetical protein